MAIFAKSNRLRTRPSPCLTTSPRTRHHELTSTDTRSVFKHPSRRPNTDVPALAGTRRHRNGPFLYRVRQFDSARGLPDRERLQRIPIRAQFSAIAFAAVNQTSGSSPRLTWVGLTSTILTFGESRSRHERQSTTLSRRVNIAVIGFVMDIVLACSAWRSQMRSRPTSGERICPDGEDRPANHRRTTRRDVMNRVGHLSQLRVQRSRRDSTLRGSPFVRTCRPVVRPQEQDGPSSLRPPVFVPNPTAGIGGRAASGTDEAAQCWHRSPPARNTDRHSTVAAGSKGRLGRRTCQPKWSHSCADRSEQAQPVRCRLRRPLAQQLSAAPHDRCHGMDAVAFINGP